jgi:glycosyltransferase involved in cell wall biosynthesis
MGDLKVCLLTPEFLPVWGGTGSYCVELVNALSDKVEFHVVTVDRSAGNGAKKAFENDSSFMYKGKVQVHTLTKSSAKDTFFFNGKMQLAVSRKLPALIKEHHLDILHSNFPAMPDLLFRAFSGNRYKTLTTIHTNIEMHREATNRSAQGTLKIEQSEKMTLLLLPYLLRCQKFYLSKERNFIFVSKFVSSLVHEAYGDVMKDYHEWIINNGVNTEVFSPEKAQRFGEFFPRLEKESCIVLFSGRLIALKGISVLAKAMKTVVSINKEAHFVFAGPGSVELLNQNMKKCAIPTNRYSVLGPVDRAKMPYLYAKSAMLVLPSFVESLPLCVIEAMSCGSPVIASNVGGLPEIIDDGQDGFLFEVGRSDKLAECISYFLENESVARNFGKRGREKVLKKFSVTRMAGDTLNVYENILRSEH